MTTDILVFLILSTAFLMVMTKRIGALTGGFCVQSFLLGLFTAWSGFRMGNVELYVVAGLILAVKVVLVPVMLSRIVRRIKVDGNLGLTLNPVVSILAALVLVFLSWMFAGRILGAQNVSLVAAFSVTLIGLFLMIFRMKAVAQIVGLLTMENGIFMAGAAITGGMPFFLEIAIAFDIFAVFLILGLFVYRINSVFTHIDTDKLNELKG